MNKIYYDGQPISQQKSDALFGLGVIDVNKLNSKESLNIILCKPDGEEIAILDEAYNVVLNLYINAVDEIEFELPFYIDSQYTQIKNYNWDETKDYLYLKVNNKIMFVINHVSDVGENINIKHIHAYSREILLSKRLLAILQGTRQLYHDGSETTVCTIKYSLDGNEWSIYNNPFTVQEGKNIFIKLYDNSNQLLNEYIWNAGDKYQQFDGIDVTYTIKDVFNKQIEVTIKIISETGNGILNILEDETAWKIGYIDPEVREDRSKGQHHRKYRTFNIRRGVWLEILYKQITELFDCIVDVDTINQIFNIYSIDNFCRNKGLYISKDNYLKHIKRETTNDEIITRLRVYGKENLSIASVNPLGTEYIEDFNYYRNAKYMPYDLLNALDNYDILLKTEYPKFYNYLQELKNMQEKEIEINNQIVDCKMQQMQKEDIKDAEIQHATHHIQYSESTGDGTHTDDSIDIDFSDIYAVDLSECNIKIKEIQRKLEEKRDELIRIKEDIKAKQEQIKALQSILNKENNFTKQQLKILDGFIKEGTWENKNIDDVHTLYDAGIKTLAKLSKPLIQFEIEIVDFLNITECQKDWDKINLGDIVNIYYDDFDLYVEAKIVKISHNITNGELQLTISNKKELNDDIKYLSDIAKMANDANNTIDAFKHKWDLSGQNTDLISQIMNNALDSAKNRILSARNQNIKIDERGIQMKDMFDDNEQLRMVNNCIAMTKDGWNSCSLAITPSGICAEQIYGKVIGSNKLIITNMNDKGESSFLVDGSHMKAINMDLSLLRKNLLNRIYMNPEVGFKIQKRDTKHSDWQDLLWLDMNGEIYAKSFHVINTNTELNDKGLVVDNGKIKIMNKNKQDAFYTDENGEMRLDGRLRVIRHLEKWEAKDKWDIEPETNRVILLDAYKDNDKGGKLLINDWNGVSNIWIGSSPNKNYTGGFLKLYNGDEKNNTERVELGTLTKNNAGIIQIKNSKSQVIVNLQGDDKENGLISIKNPSNQNDIIKLKANQEGGIIGIYGNETDVINATLGTVEDAKFPLVGGYLQLYNKSFNKKRVQIGARRLEDAGSVELYGKNNFLNLYMSAVDNDNGAISSGVFKLFNSHATPTFLMYAETPLNILGREGSVDSALIIGQDKEHAKVGIFGGGNNTGALLELASGGTNSHGLFPNLSLGDLSHDGSVYGGNVVVYENMRENSHIERVNKRRVHIFVNQQNNAVINLWDSSGNANALGTIFTENGSMKICHKSGRSITFSNDGKIIFN